MPAITTILVPVDFSAASEKALAHACDMADAFGASVHLLHVLENPFAPGALMETYAPLPDDFLENLERDARLRLEGMLTDAQKKKYAAIMVTRIGGPAEQILGYLDEQSIDLLVVATAGRGAVARLLMGSVADRLIRSAHCPVLTVHPHDRPKSDSGHRAA